MRIHFLDLEVMPHEGTGDKRMRQASRGGCSAIKLRNRCGGAVPGWYPDGKGLKNYSHMEGSERKEAIRGLCKNINLQGLRRRLQKKTGNSIAFIIEYNISEMAV